MELENVAWDGVFFIIAAVGGLAIALRDGELIVGVLSAVLILASLRILQLAYESEAA